MTIVLVGGGSGGHITPILAVAEELKHSQPDTRLVYIGQKGDPLGDVAASSKYIDESFRVSAGKFRRYHGEGIRQIFDFPTLLKNIRDFFRLIAGTWQSYRLLGRLKPGAAFTPGGFVGVPVGLAAWMHHIPFVTHDLDALPGLANRINARHAAIHAVGLPKELYPYPAETTEYVGVPVIREYQPVTVEMQKTYRKETGLEGYEQVLFIIGGGLGAQRLNEAVLAIAVELLSIYPKLAIVHTVGRINAVAMEAAYDELLTPGERDRVQVKGFLEDVYRYSGAADVVITRAGATNMAEFAAQHKACIIVPNPQLTGGHQTKNAGYFTEANAALIVTEDELQTNQAALLPVVRDLLDDPAKRVGLGEKLGTFAKPNAAADLASILLKVTGRGNENQAT